MVYNIWRKILSQTECSVYIQWIPSHQGIVDNTMPDEFAQTGCKIPEAYKNEIPLTFKDVIVAQKGLINRMWQEEFKEIARNATSDYFKLVPSPTSPAWFSKLSFSGLDLKRLLRLRTNHGLCGVRRKMFGFNQPINVINVMWWTL